MATMGALSAIAISIFFYGQIVNTGLIRSNLKIILNNYTCEYDSEYILLECRIYEDSKQNWYLNIYTDHRKDLGNDIYILYQILFENNKNEYIYLVKGKRIDLCKFFKKPQLDPLLGLVFAALYKHGHLLNSCPVRKMDYNVTLPMHDLQLPSFTPPGNYKYIMQVTMKIDGKFHQISRSIIQSKILKI